MAKHIITISDEDVGISIKVSSDGCTESLAGITTRAMLNWIKAALPEAEKKAALFGTCTCDGCKATRAKAATEAKPTIH